MNGFPDELMDALLLQSEVRPRAIARFARWLGIGCWTPESRGEQTALARRVIDRRSTQEVTHEASGESPEAQIALRPTTLILAQSTRGQVASDAHGDLNSVAGAEPAQPASNVPRDGRVHYLPGVAA